MPMHCSANVGARRRRRRSSSGCPAPARRPCRPIPNRTLLGDDEHGWAPGRRLQLRGRLLRQDDPALARGRARDLRDDRALRHGARERRHRSRSPACRISTTRRGPRTRAAPTRSTSSANASATGRAGHPKNIVMLTCDAFGVLPPIAKLTPAEAMYHFLSGYTAKVAGTEKGVKDPGGDLLDLLRRALHAAPPVRLRQPAARPHRQALRRLLARQHGLDRRQVRRRPPHADPRHAAPAHGGPRRLAQPRRFPPRSRISASRCRPRCPGVEPHILYPVKTWQDKAAFAETAKRLVDMFTENFKRFEATSTRTSGPPRRRCRSRPDRCRRRYSPDGGPRCRRLVRRAHRGMDVLVIGAGVVGLAVAPRRSRVRGHEVVVAERDRRASATGVSSRNSEVIHGGMYYPAGSLRARHCVAGRRMLYALLREPRRAAPQLRQAHRRDERARTGEDRGHPRAGHGERGRGAVLARRARRPGRSSRTSPAPARVLSPETGIIDSHAFMLALQGDLEAHGGVIAFHAPVERLARADRRLGGRSVGGADPMATFGRRRGQRGEPRGAGARAGDARAIRRSACRSSSSPRATISAASAGRPSRA